MNGSAAEVDCSPLFSKAGEQVKCLYFRWLGPFFAVFPVTPHTSRGRDKMKSCVGRRTIKKTDIKLPVFRPFFVLENNREQENRPVL